jgi:ABC-type glycerol-3-phosphate transport system substrate-binding protein
MQWQRKKFLVLMIALALLAAACSTDDGTTESTGATEPTSGATEPTSSLIEDSENARRYEGVELTLMTYASTTEFDYYATLMDDFTRETGIKVNYVQQPVAAQDQKIPLLLAAKDPSLDVFFTGSENIGSYVGVSGVLPLDSFISDSNLTPESWDFADLAPAILNACQNGGVTYCIPSHAGGGLLYYNTRMFEEAGITAPPKNPDELLDYAKRLTTDEHAGFCVRGDNTQNLYTAFQLWQWFYPYDNDVTGTYFDKDWNFIIGQQPNANEFGSWFREILQKAAPAGIATYLVTNCLEDFQQGRVAMWHDDSGMIPEVLDPKKSRVSEETAFWSLPCQAVNPDNCTLVQPFGTWINAASENPEAAWLLVQFLTSKETQNAAAIDGSLLTPSRVSVVNNPEVVASLPATFAEALDHILAHPDAALLPFIPEGVAILPPMLNGLSELITSGDSVDEVMARMTAGVEEIMKAAGYPKPFPEG